VFKADDDKDVKKYEDSLQADDYRVWRGIKGKWGVRVENPIKLKNIRVI